MRYAKTVLLAGGQELLVRNAVASDARALRETMQRTHAQTGSSELSVGDRVLVGGCG